MTVPFGNIGPKRFMLLAFFTAMLLGGINIAFGEGAVRSTLFSESEVNAVGLTRPWFNQVVMDYNQSHISHVTLHDEQLFITTDSGHIHVIDGQTGGTLWSRQLGNKDAETSAPAVNSKVVAVLHGAKMNILDRTDGRRLLEIPMQAPPGAAPQLGEKFLYVPIITGKIFAYPLRKFEKTIFSGPLSYENLDSLRQNPKLSAEIKKKIDLLLENTQIEKYALQPILPHEIQSCPALGHPIIQPIMGTQTRSDEVLIWITEQGRMSISHTHYADEKKALKLMFQVSMVPEELFMGKSQLMKVFEDYQNEMYYRPVYVPTDMSERNERRENTFGGMVLIGSQTGFVFAVNDMTGDVDWEFCAGNDISSAVGTSEETCYISTRNGEFFAVSLKTGEEVWQTDHVQQFICASAKALYVLDTYGSLAILDKETGKKLKSLPLDLGTYAVFNVDSDRIYLVAPDGLVQCLHEIESPEPVRYREKSTERAERFIQETEKEAAERAGTSEKEEKPAEKPAAENAAPAETAPAAEPAAAPAADTEDDTTEDSDNPFD